MKRPLDSGCVESWQSGISGPRPTGDPAALSRLWLSFLLPGFVVIFVHPDSPWPFQQSGLWEPDASHTVQMSGAESLKDSSLGAITWGHGPCPLCTRQEGPHAWRMVTGRAGSSARACLGMLSEPWGLSFATVPKAPGACRISSVLQKVVPAARASSLHTVAVGSEKVSVLWSVPWSRPQAGRGTERSLGTSWWFLLSYCLQEMRQSPCSGPQGTGCSRPVIVPNGACPFVESTCLAPVAEASFPEPRVMPAAPCMPGKRGLWVLP